MADLIISRKDAVAQGLKHYRTGKPCKRGHIAERVASSASCTVCNAEKNRRFKADNADRLRSQANKRNAIPGAARTRRLALRAQWREENRDKLRLEEARRRAEQPEKMRENSKRHYWKDPEKGRERNAAYREANPEKRKQYYDAVGKHKNREYREAHKDELKAYYARWQRENRDRVYAAIHKRRALKKNSSGTYTAEEIAAILKAQNYRCPYCGADLKKSGHHIDHIVPLSRGGSNDKGNIQATCPPCNLRKGALDPIVYAQTIGLLL